MSYIDDLTNEKKQNVILLRTIMEMQKGNKTLRDEVARLVFVNAQLQQNKETYRKSCKSWMDKYHAIEKRIEGVASYFKKG